MFNVPIFPVRRGYVVSQLHASTREQPPHHEDHDDYDDYGYDYLAHAPIMHGGITLIQPRPASRPAEP